MMSIIKIKNRGRKLSCGFITLLLYFVPILYLESFHRAGKVVRRLVVLKEGLLLPEFFFGALLCLFGTLAVNFIGQLARNAYHRGGIIKKFDKAAADERKNLVALGGRELHFAELDGSNHVFVVSKKAHQSAVRNREDELLAVTLKEHAARGYNF